jgi:hypothetical protein
VITGDEAGHIGDGGLNHGEAVFRRTDLSRAGLLPGDIRHHQDDQIELKPIANIDRRHEMSDVRGVECAAEDPDTGVLGA